MIYFEKRDDDDDTVRMKAICLDLGLDLKVDVRLYDFERHIDVYQKILRLVKAKPTELQFVLDKVNRNRVQDFKAKTKSGGRGGDEPCSTT